jgi:hypothetical protein
MRCQIQSFRSSLCVGIITATAVCLLPSVFAQGPVSDSKGNSQNAAAFVREVILNEIESQLRDNSLWCYREQRQEDDGG